MESLNNFETIKRLGKGVFGTVDLAYCHSLERYVAVKRISKRLPNYRSRHLENEYQAGSALLHPQIPKLLYFEEAQDDAFFVFEYVRGMDLISFLEKQNFAPLNEDFARKLFIELLDPLLYCHEHNIAHRYRDETFSDLRSDIKLDNIMIDESGTLHLIDFGLCEWKSAEKCDGLVGSIEYCPPEILRKDKQYNGYKADVWSSGVVLYALLFGLFPYTTKEIRNMTSWQIQPSLKLWKRKKTLSNSAKHLLEGMLQMDPNRRMSLKEIAVHPWILKESINTFKA